MRSFLPSVALVSAAFLFGCQDMGSGPVGLEGPQFNRPDALDADACAKLGRVFEAPHCHEADVTADEPLLYAATADGFTCNDGADITNPFGQVIWENIRRKGTFHIHATVQLRNVASGTYDIFANQDVLCNLDEPFIDFKPGSSHKTEVIVDNTGNGTGNGDARMRLSFGAGDQGDALIPAGHAPGVHRLWVTLKLGGVVKFRSRAFGVEIKDHKGHEGG